MLRTITREQYSDYVTDWVAWTREQWEENGIEIIFTLDCDDDYYYLTVDIAQFVYDFYDENPDIDRSELERTELFVEEFGCKICDDLEEVNRYVTEELPNYCKFAECKDGTIVGN